MNRSGGQHDRHQHQRNLARVKAGDQSDAPQQLHCENRIRKEAGKAHGLKELRGARKRKDQQLQQGMCDPHDAETHAEQG